MIAFVASIIADIQNPYPKYAWWTLAYSFCCIIGILIVFATDSAAHYSLAVSQNVLPFRVGSNVPRLLGILQPVS